MVYLYVELFLKVKIGAFSSTRLKSLWKALEFFKIQLILDASFEGNYLILSISFQFVKSSSESCVVMNIKQH